MSPERIEELRIQAGYSKGGGLDGEVQVAEWMLELLVEVERLQYAVGACKELAQGQKAKIESLQRATPVDSMGTCGFSGPGPYHASCADLLGERLAKATAALRAVLIFHSGRPWHESQAEWAALAGDKECTAKVICDMVREALGDG